MAEQDKRGVFEIPKDRAHDPREQEASFLRLPDEAKDELRSSWRFSERVVAEVRRRRKRTLRLHLIESTLLFAILVPFQWASLGLGILLGLCCGFLSHRLQAGALLQAWIGGMGFGLFMFLSGWMNPYAVILATFFSGLLGMVHQIQRADRSET